MLPRNFNEKDATLCLASNEFEAGSLDSVLARMSHTKIMTRGRCDRTETFYRFGDSADSDPMTEL